jgi:hypothetical protein
MIAITETKEWDGEKHGYRPEQAPPSLILTAGGPRQSLQWTINGQGLKVLGTNRKMAEPRDNIREFVLVLHRQSTCTLLVQRHQEARGRAEIKADPARQPAAAPARPLEIGTIFNGGGAAVWIADLLRRFGYRVRQCTWPEWFEELSAATT